MHVEQISVFLENKSGRLSEVTGILAENQINIRALALADTSDFGVLRLIVDEKEKAVAALKDNGFTVGKGHLAEAKAAINPSLSGARSAYANQSTPAKTEGHEAHVGTHCGTSEATGNETSAAKTENETDQQTVNQDRGRSPAISTAPKS